MGFGGGGREEGPCKGYIYERWAWRRGDGGLELKGSSRGTPGAERDDKWPLKKSELQSGVPQKAPWEGLSENEAGSPAAPGGSGGGGTTEQREAEARTRAPGPPSSPLGGRQQLQLVDSPVPADTRITCWVGSRPARLVGQVLLDRIEKARVGRRSLSSEGEDNMTNWPPNYE